MKKGHIVINGRYCAGPSHEGVRGRLGKWPE